MKKIILILSLLMILPLADLHGNGDEISKEIIETRLNDRYSVRLKQISESEYAARKKEAERLRHKPYKVITDIAEARKLFGKSVKQVEVYDKEQDARYSAVEIIFKDGVKKRFKWRSLDTNGFIAYYPEPGVLILNHEADGEHPIDLNDSANEYAGNPRYHSFSPDKQLRIAGYYPGGAVDGVQYFLEKWNPKKKKYEFVGNFNDHFGENYVLSFLFAGDWFWTSNSKAVFRTITHPGYYYELEVIEI